MQSTEHSPQRKGRILVLDDQPAWRKELVLLLQKHGYEAHAVETVTEALAEIQENLYHILILDINMQSGDKPDSQGLTLLKELATRNLMEAIQVIILSAYGTKEHMHQAFKEYKVADFLEKGDLLTDQKTLLASIYAITKAPGNSNLNLHLHLSWPSQLNRTSIVQKLRLDTPIANTQKRARDKIGEELEDLFCRLFHNAQSVRVQPLTPGWSGAGVLRIQPFYHNGGKGHDLVVKFGSIHKIATEYHNFQEHVEHFISEGRSSIALHIRQTVHLGGIIYSYLDAGGDRMVDFATFYREHSSDEINASLQQLITRTCDNWYTNRTSLQPIDPAAIYQSLFWLPATRLEQTLAKPLQTLRVNGKSRLTFTALANGRSFSNPLTITSSTTGCFSYLSKTHGDLNPHNMLVDANKHIWLIDFQSTSTSHILRDIATLDAVIRFQILLESDATLAERLELEEILCNIENYAQLDTISKDLQTSNQSLRKAFATVVFLRTLAREIMSPNRQAEIDEYYIALFYMALNTLRFTTTLEPVQREHALLSASLLADRLKLSSQNNASRKTR